MAAICTGSVSPNACGHRVVTIGEITLHLQESEMVPLSPEELTQFYRFAVRHKGIELAALLNRVLVGDEATNVKQYNLQAPGTSVTLTNIGTAWKDVLPGANGQRSLVEFTGCTEFRLVVTANLVGTGPFGFRVVRDGDLAVLYENSAIALTGERELDTDWLPIPNGVNSLEVVRFQAKSTVAADDPLIRRCVLLVR